MTRSFFTKVATAATVATFAVVSTAQAQTVGSTNTLFNFNGSFRVTDPVTAPDLNANSRLRIDFLTDQTVENFDQAAQNGTIRAVEETNLVGVTTTAGLPTSQGTIRDLLVGPAGFVGTTNPFVTIGAYTFNITSALSNGNGSATSGFGPIVLTDLGGSTLASFRIAGTVTGGTLAAGSTFTGTFTSAFNGLSAAQLVSQIDQGQTLGNSFAARFDITQNVIPEPSTYALMASGVAMLGAFARRRRQQA